MSVPPTGQAANLPAAQQPTTSQAPNLDPNQIGSFLNQSYNSNPPHYLTNPNPYQFIPLASTSAYSHPQLTPAPNGFTPLSQQPSTQSTVTPTGPAPDLPVDAPGPSQSPAGAGTADGGVARPDPLGKGKKRKSSAGPGQANGAPSEEEGEKEKRQKIPRACDNCRRKKIRCNPIPDVEPQTCVHCKGHNVECTWFLPITETRFKRKKGDEPPNPIGVGLPLSKASGDSLSSVNNPASPLYNHPAAHTSPYTAGLAGSIAGSSPDTPGGSGLRKEARIVGPTSISHLMHSTSTFPHERMGPVDDKYAQSLTVDETGDGFIRILSTGDGDPLGRGGSEHVAIQGIERADAEKLLNFFFSTHAEHFPVVSKADFLSTASPTPLLFNALCGISALSHHVAPAILRTIKGTIRATMRDEDVLDNSSISNIQSLLVYAMSMELEKGTAASKTWNLLGVAIRMAQDLGLHRKMGSEGSAQSQSDHTELRRRVWGGCVIADRWAAAVYGQPMMIDLADCDCQLPSAFDIKRPGLELDTEENRRPFLFNSALVDLSILLGRILKAVYSPTGILNLSAEDGQGLIDALERWLIELPEELKFKGPDKSSSAAGFLHLLYIPVRFLVTRPFMRISFQLPEKFANISVGTQSWAVVEKEAREAIEWVDKNESCLEGWFMGIYAHFLCSLIQYHSHIRKRDTTSLATLRLARDTLKRLVVPDGECHVRAKIAEIAHLLYHTAGTVSKWAPDSANGTVSPVAADGGAATLPPLNPTVGVRQREQDWHAKYRKGVAARQAASGAVPPAIPAYANSLRTTHEEEPARTEVGVGQAQAQLAGANGSGSGTAVGAGNGASDGVDQLAASLLPGLTGGTDVLPPVGGFDFGAGGVGGGDFDGGFNFNPNLNFGAVPGMGGMFDTFGLGGEGAPQLDGILDWDNWSSFFSTVPGGGPGV